MSTKIGLKYTLHRLKPKFNNKGFTGTFHRPIKANWPSQDEEVEVYPESEVYYRSPNPTLLDEIAEDEALAKGLRILPADYKKQVRDAQIQSDGIFHTLKDLLSYLGISLSTFNTVMKKRDCIWNDLYIGMVDEDTWLMREEKSLTDDIELEIKVKSSHYEPLFRLYDKLGNRLSYNDSEYSNRMWSRGFTLKELTYKVPMIYIPQIEKLKPSDIPHGILYELSKEDNIYIGRCDGRNSNAFKEVASYTCHKHRIHDRPGFGLNIDPKEVEFRSIGQSWTGVCYECSTGPIPRVVKEYLASDGDESDLKILISEVKEILYSSIPLERYRDTFVPNHQVIDALLNPYYKSYKRHSHRISDYMDGLIEYEDNVQEYQPVRKVAYIKDGDMYNSIGLYAALQNPTTSEEFKELYNINSTGAKITYTTLETSPPISYDGNNISSKDLQRILGWIYK